MSEKEFNKIFSERLRYYLNKYDMSQSDLAKRLGVGTTSVYNWINAIKTPRMDKVDALCSIFNCKRSDLMNDKPEPTETYYLNDETRKIAQEVYDNPNLKILFDATRNASPEDIKLITEMAKRFKATNND